MEGPALLEHLVIGVAVAGAMEAEVHDAAADMEVFQRDIRQPDGAGGDRL